MKKFFSVLVLATLFIACVDHKEDPTYWGVIVDKVYDAPSSGYKSSRDPEYGIYLREDRSKKVIRVNVDIPTYYDCKIGERKGFKISNWSLYQMGNTRNSDYNLYGE